MRVPGLAARDLGEEVSVCNCVGYDLLIFGRE